MRVQIDFYINETRKLYTPVNEAITAYIYRAIAKTNKKYADNLHEEGFTQSGYKKFVYHTYAISQNKKLICKQLKKGKATLIFSSALEDTVINFVKGMIKIGKIQIFGRSYEIEEIKHIKERGISNSQKFNIISPVYATRIDGKWLNPKEMEGKLEENLIEKYHALYKKLPQNNIRIKLLPSKREYVHYKNDIFRGYLGNVIIEGDKEAIKLAYRAGLGARCGQGLGLLKRV